MATTVGQILSIYIKGVIVCVLAALPILGYAQSDTIPSDKIITNAKMIGIGYTNILDTYLSPEKYTGTEVRYISHTVREKIGSRWSQEIVHNGDISSIKSRSGDGNEIAGMYNFSYAWHYNWNFGGGHWNLKAGGMVDTYLGFIYNTRNSNNPAQARLFLNISPNAAVTYRFRMWNRPYSLRYEVSAPLFGVMFSPNYGQSYYEIFSEGNYDHNVVPTTFISTPSLRQMISIDVMLGKTTIRLGYLGDFQQSKVNNLKTHVYTHAFVIGIVKHFKLVNIRP
jgi:hypothetical protein